MSRFIRSMKTSPGSPVSQALETISSNTFLALRRLTTWPVRGFTSSYSPSFLRASMKASVTATEMLKLASSPAWRFMRMKSRMSGWSTLRMPMLAPLLAPPCLITSVAVL